MISNEQSVSARFGDRCFTEDSCFGIRKFQHWRHACRAEGVVMGDLLKTHRKRDLGRDAPNQLVVGLSRRLKGPTPDRQCRRR
jgi:hypothetical protein